MSLSPVESAAVLLRTQYAAVLLRPEGLTAVTRMLLNVVSAFARSSAAVPTSLLSKRVDCSVRRGSAVRCSMLSLSLLSLCTTHVRKRVHKNVMMMITARRCTSLKHVCRADKTQKKRKGTSPDKKRESKCKSQSGDAKR